MLFLLLLLGGCRGYVLGTDDSSSERVRGDGPADRGVEPDRLLPARIRRLSRIEYRRTLRSLFGEGVLDGEVLPADDARAGFTAHDSQRVTPLVADRLWLQTEAIAQRAVDRLDVPCTLEGDGSACAEEVIRSFGRRAYRRPLEEVEVADLVEVYLAGRDGGDFRSGIALVLEAMLQSPSFLYRTELGDAEAPPTGPVEMTPFEIASQVSYLANAEPPDEQLLEAAGRGELADPERVVAHFRRLRREAPVDILGWQYVPQWLGTTGLERADKSSPVFTDELRRSMRSEAERFVTHVLREGDGSWRSLLTADYTFADADLAALYGEDPAAAGESLQRIPLDPSERAGLLTQSAFLATYAEGDESHPVLRGLFVRRKLLCQDIPEPPPTLSITPPPPSDAKTTRERYEQHVADEFCATCHAQIDPLGFGFEHYDGLGRFRAEENGHPVDASGELTGTDHVDGPYYGAVELAGRLSESEVAQRCFIEHLGRFAMGRDLSQEQGQWLDAVYEEFAANDTNVNAALLELVRSPQFVERGPMEPAAEPANTEAP